MVLHHSCIIIKRTIEGAPVCDAASRVIEANVTELTVHVAITVVKQFVQILFVLQTTYFLT